MFDQFKQCMTELVSIEVPLKPHPQYLKFIEKVLIPEIGKDCFYNYLKRFSIQLIEDEKILNLKDLNAMNLCKHAINSSVITKNYRLKCYPVLNNTISDVVAVVKKEKGGTVEAIIQECLKCISILDSLIEPLSVYRSSVSWQYLKFVEESLIPTIGEDKFCEYLEGFLIKNDHDGKLNNYTQTELLKLLLSDKVVNSPVKNNGRYPIINRITTNALRKITSERQKDQKFKLVFLQQKIEKFNLMSEIEIRFHCLEIIENEFNLKRKRLNKIEFFKVFYDNSFIKSYFKKKNDTTLKHHKLVSDIIHNEMINQRQLFNNWNLQEMSLSKDQWTIYFIRGISMLSIKIDFDIYRSETLKKELKLYLKNSYSPSEPHSTYKDFSNIVRGLSVLQEKFSIERISQINSIHVGFLIQHLEHNTDFAVLTIKHTIIALSKLTQFLIEFNSYKYKPKENVFRKITIHNADAMSKNTAYIPDEVLKQIQLHIHELNEKYRLVYKILSQTGLRPKEVLQLELESSQISNEYEGYAKLKYIPYKIIKARKRRGLGDFSFVYIPLELHFEIERYVDKKKEFFSNYEISYVFAEKSNQGVFLLKTRDFCLALNKLIIKHNICDSEGNVWNFTAKQTRKTVAVNLIENNATPQEVASQLGHLETDTTEKYYIEVKKKKLAELNSEFYKKKFELNVGEENLSLYSEEERRKLYIDFCLNQREVEFGSCTKHPSEGECGKRVGASSCAVCPKLCTGTKYLTKWENLKDSQRQSLDELERIYGENNITDYGDFIEYKKTKTLLIRYETVIDEITSNQRKGDLVVAGRE